MYILFTIFVLISICTLLDLIIGTEEFAEGVEILAEEMED